MRYIIVGPHYEFSTNVINIVCCMVNIDKFLSRLLREHLMGMFEMSGSETHVMHKNNEQERRCNSLSFMATQFGINDQNILSQPQLFFNNYSQNLFSLKNSPSGTNKYENMCQGVLST